MTYLWGVGERYIKVIVPAPLEGALTYRVQEGTGICVGCRVTVPLGKNRVCTALVIKDEVEAVPQGVEIRDIIEVIDEVPAIRLWQLDFWEWMASYYLCTPGEIYKVALSKRNFRKKTVIPVENSIQAPSLLTLLQEEALENIRRIFITKEVCLLQECAHAGKTEIYIHLMYETLQQGRQALYILPENVLTASFIDRLRNVFGTKLLVWYSGRSDRQRAEVWNTLLKDNSPCVVAGVKTALFLPFAQLGLVIVDNEHEAGYKQTDPAPRYHARSTAIILAKMHKAKTLLGSAVPSIDSYRNALAGKYGFVTLNIRYGDYFPPQFITVNIKEERRKKKMRHPLFSPLLIQRIEQSFHEGGQTVLFQNRRDTERTEAATAELFPAACIARFDPDVAPTQKIKERILYDFNHTNIDILICGQTQTGQAFLKELDFKRVDTLGILCMDSLMNFTDFRAHERAYQTVIQMTGYALRGDKPCTVVLQSSQAEHPLMDMITRFDYAAMAQLQLEERKTFRYPPYCRLITVVLRSRHKEKLRLFAEKYVERLQVHLGEGVFGPVVPVISHPQQKLHVQHLIIKVDNTAATAPLRVLLVNIRREMLGDPLLGKGMFVYYDVDL
jgi:primosomal protein N' (replication factor Y)